MFFPQHISFILHAQFARFVLVNQHIFDDREGLFHGSMSLAGNAYDDSRWCQNKYEKLLLEHMFGIVASFFYFSVAFQISRALRVPPAQSRLTVYRRLSICVLLWEWPGI